jgi:hypothetical protein
MIYLIIAYILNVIDYIFTSYWIAKFGIDIEVNPIGRWMFENNVSWVFKIIVIGLLFILLWHLIKKQPNAILVAYIMLGVYGFIVLYHIIIAVTIL